MTRILALGGILLAALGGCSKTPAAQTATTETAPYVTAADPISAGRYLVIIGGCNDCHTDGYAPTVGAQPPETEWLKGSAIGFRGPWGVSYPSNLRLSVHQSTEDAWIAMARERKSLPPMPWPILNHMSETDLRAIYKYIYSLKPVNAAAPPPLAPGEKQDRPAFYFVPLAPGENPPH